MKLELTVYLFYSQYVLLYWCYDQFYLNYTAVEIIGPGFEQNDKIDRLHTCHLSTVNFIADKIVG